MRHNMFWASLIALSSLVLTGLVVTDADADIVEFDFNNNTAFDGASPGTEFSATGVTDTVIVTLVDVFAPEIVDNMLTGNTVTATTSIPNGGGLGVNGPLSNGDFETFAGGNGGGVSSEGNQFNVGEGVVLSFDTDVIIDEFDFQSFEAGSGFVVSVAGGPSLTLGQVQSPETNDFADPFSGLVIAAGTNITFEAFGPSNPDQTPDAFTDIRISEILVDTNVAVPEPSSLALLGLLGGLVAIRRRR